MLITLFVVSNAGKIVALVSNILKVLGVTLFYMGNYCIRAMKLYLKLFLFVNLVDEIVTRKN